jgi:hypothetical protein
MKRRLTSLILGATLGGALLLGAPKEARAATYSGYVCTVRNTAEGSISFSIYSGPDCTGSYMRTFSACSAGSEICSGSEYSTAARDHLHRGLMQAIASNLRAEAYDTGYPFYVFQYVTFRAD